MPTQDPPNTLGHFLMHVDMKCVRLWESPSPCWADARHGAFVGVHTLYSLYIASTCTKHRYERSVEALQPLQPLKPLKLYSSTSAILYSTHPHDRNHCLRGFIWFLNCTPPALQPIM